MNSRLLINLILVTLIILLTSYLMLSKQDGPSSQPPNSSFPDPEQINKIQILREGRESLLIIKSGPGWQIAEPVQLSASMFRINSILQFLQSKIITRFNAEKSRLPLYGLEPAKVKLTLNNDTFYFGDVNPLDLGRFVYYGDNIYVVEDKLYQQLLQPKEFFFSKRLINQSSPLYRIQCGPLILQKINDKWQQSGVSTDRTPDEILKISETWTKLEATSTTASSSIDSVGEILLDFANGTRTVINIKATEPDLILTPDFAEYDYWFPAPMIEALAIPESGC